MKKMRMIKRYANRKLYDSQTSGYVTLDDIAAMLRDGYDIQVVDNKSGQDISNATLAQILFETEKKGSRVSMAVLKQLILAGHVEAGNPAASESLC